MNKKTFDDSNWREEYKNYTSSKRELELLENGAKSLSQSWILGALYQKWKRIKNIPPEPETPECKSSFGDWNNNAKKLVQNDK